MSDFNVIGNVHIIVLPWYEFGPTAVTTYLPTPSRILLPLTMKGSNLLLNLAPWIVLSRAYSAGTFFTASDSPVAADSSALILCPSGRTPSTGMRSPGSRCSMSPTNISYTLSRLVFPPRITLTFRSSFYSSYLCIGKITHLLI